MHPHNSRLNSQTRAKLGQAISCGHREACLTNSGQIKGVESKSVIKSIMIARKLPDGVYIKGTVQGYPLLFTTDTGASETIISNLVFEKLKPGNRPALVKE